MMADYDFIMMSESTGLLSLPSTFVQRGKPGVNGCGQAKQDTSGKMDGIGVTPVLPLQKFVSP